MAVIIIIVVLARMIAYAATSNIRVRMPWRNLSGRWRKRIDTGSLLNRTYIDVRALFMDTFRETPSIIYIEEVEEKTVIEYISKGFAGKIKTASQSSFYDWEEKRERASFAIFVLEEKVILHVSYETVSILFGSANRKKADELAEVFIQHKLTVKEDEPSINIINYRDNELCLKRLDIKPGNLDLSLYYNEDFMEVDKRIRERLSKENDKGIVLLHGLPGTGKTTYLRYLIGTLKKKVLFLSPAVANKLGDPHFIDLLIDNSNCILVIEDAENIIMERRYSSHSSVSNLLNISDGLLSDCLNVQIICTFNSELHLVDEALMRKGRMIARYEFGKLETKRAQQLSDHLGLKRIIDKPMTLAEITNPDQIANDKPKTNTIGFRRELVEN